MQSPVLSHSTLHVYIDHACILNVYCRAKYSQNYHETMSQTHQSKEERYFFLLELSMFYDHSHSRVQVQFLKCCFKMFKNKTFQNCKLLFCQNFCIIKR